VFSIPISILYGYHFFVFRQKTRYQNLHRHDQRPLPRLRIVDILTRGLPHLTAPMKWGKSCKWRLIYIVGAKCEPIVFSAHAGSNRLVKLINNPWIQNRSMCNVVLYPHIQSSPDFHKRFPRFSQLKSLLFQ
jgi:hypothetical protein